MAGNFIDIFRVQHIADLVAKDGTTNNPEDVIIRKVGKLAKELEDG